MVNSPSNSSYSWDDIVRIHHTSGEVFSVQLSKIRESATFVGYTCTSCGESTTLAGGNCGSCGNPFETLELDEAKSLFPTVSVREDDPTRFAFLLLNRAWACMQCNSYNVNFPRTGDHSHVACINCGKSYQKGESILLEDGDIVLEGTDPVQKFRQKILDIIERKRPREIETLVAPRVYHAIPRGDISPMASGSDAGLSGYSLDTSTPCKRNTLAIVSGVLGASLAGWVIYYYFIQEIDTRIQVLGHNWERVIPVEQYKLKKGEDWERDVDMSLAELRITDKVLKEASWDSYEVKTGEKTVTDYGSCVAYTKSCTPTRVTLSSGAIIAGPESCTESCTTHGTKIEPIMETRYHKHPYVQYTYMGWEQIDRLMTAGGNKNPYGHNGGSYKFDGVHFREGSRQEVYRIQLKTTEGETENLSISQVSWSALNTGDSCAVKVTRATGVRTGSLLENISTCSKNADF